MPAEDWTDHEEPAPVVAPEPAPVISLNLATSSATVVVGTGSVPPGAYVAEAPGVDSGYQPGGAVYLRITPDVEFPDGANVVTVGYEVRQGGFAGFSEVAGYVNVGPCHPAYAAANLAFLDGATAIKVVGLSAAEKERLQPYFNELPSRGVPVTVSLA